MTFQWCGIRFARLRNSMHDRLIVVEPSDRRHAAPSCTDSWGAPTQRLLAIRSVTHERRLGWRRLRDGRHVAVDRAAAWTCTTCTVGTQHRAAAPGPDAAGMVRVHCVAITGTPGGTAGTPGVTQRTTVGRASCETCRTVLCSWPGKQFSIKNNYLYILKIPPKQISNRLQN